jgi:hypothetical protein
MSLRYPERAKGGRRRNSRFVTTGLVINRLQVTIMAERSFWPRLQKVAI